MGLKESRDKFYDLFDEVETYILNAVDDYDHTSRFYVDSMDLLRRVQEAMFELSNL